LTLPPGIEPEEAILWAPIMAEPPMMQYHQLSDGSLYLRDILKMNLMLQHKAKVRRQQEEQQKARRRDR